MAAIQKWRKTYYDSKMKAKTITTNDLVLLYDSRFQKFLGKFKLHWMGPYEVKMDHDNGSFELVDFESTPLLTRINGYRFEKYHK